MYRGRGGGRVCVGGLFTSFKPDLELQIMQNILGKWFGLYGFYQSDGVLTIEVEVRSRRRGKRGGGEAGM